MPADGHAVSTSTVERALRRRGLLLPVGYRADRKSWAVILRRVFHDPPRQSNRVWQTDFSEFETSSGGIWRICAVIDYATKYCLAATVTPTARGQDAVACLLAAVQHAQRLLGLEDLRVDRGEVDLLDETTGELLRTVPARIAVVSDNGPCFRGATFAEAFTGDDPLLRHVRTRVKSLQANGVIERFFGTLKYEHLFRGPINDTGALAVEVQRFRQIYNTIRPTKPSPTASHATPTSAERVRSAAIPGVGDPRLVFVAQVGLWQVLGYRDQPVVILRADGKVLSLGVAMASDPHQPVTGRRIVGVQACHAAHQPSRLQQRVQP
jgi:putative transposase